MFEKNFEEERGAIKIEFGDIDDIKDLPKDLEVGIEQKEDELGIELGSFRFNYEELEDLIIGGKTKLLLAKEKGDIVGFIAYTKDKSGDNDNFIEMMWVKKEYRSTGLASNILEKAIDEMRDGDISLNLRGGLLAGGFFGKHGFLKNHTTEGYNKHTLKRE